jgi:hypothetical protein
VTLYYGLGFIFLFILAIYFLPNHKFFSRPHYLIVLGFGVCILAAIFNDLTEVIINKFPDVAKENNIGVLKQIISFSFASLGGGIIGAGFMIRVQIEHRNQKQDLQKKLTFLNDDNLKLEAELSAARENFNQAIIDVCITEIYLNKREIRNVNSELSIMNKV